MSSRREITTQQMSAVTQANSETFLQMNVSMLLSEVRKHRLKLRRHKRKIRKLRFEVKYLEARVRKLEKSCIDHAT